MINAIIIEDEERSSRVLEKLLADYCPDIVISGTAKTIKDGKQLINSKNPELVFLDIKLSDGNGFRLLQELEAVDFKIIFTTAYSEFALKAFKCSALDYLLKPVNIDELVFAVEKYKSYGNNKMYPASIKALQDNIVWDNKAKIKTIGLATLNEIQFILIDDIIRLEAASNYTHFYIERTPKITVSHTIKYYEDLFDRNDFMRVHQSHIINLRKVKKYIRGKVGSIVMNDGCTLDVSPKKKDDFLRALNWV
jgi:two-component system LytT family response regulator